MGKVGVRERESRQRVSQIEAMLVESANIQVPKVKEGVTMNEQKMEFGEITARV